MKCGLLGRKLGHSYSPQIHAILGSYDYALFEKEPEELEDFLRHGDFTGINVTIPYKQAVIPYLDELTQVAKSIGAVNTIVRRPDGSLLGHNTDCFGFRAMAERCGVEVRGKKALILGSGGASRTAQAVLKELGAKVVVISRSGEDNYGNLHRHADAAMLVNTTPVGMYPHAWEAPVELDHFPALQCVLDVVYNPAKTKLLLDAQYRGIPWENGLWMLVAQAKEAAEYFTGKAIDDAVIGKIHGALGRQMKNIVLIGMPGCGKSTVGKLLAEKIGKTFVDADAQIETLAGMSIPEIFKAEGEEGFRNWETKVLTRLGQESGLVIATGGGCVTRVRNLPLLTQNGQIFWLTRSIASLPREGRPLSMAADLQQMYRVRKPLYQAFANWEIDNNGLPEQTAERIVEIWEGTA